VPSLPPSRHQQPATIKTPAAYLQFVVLLFAFLSGFSALLYQILWAREFAVVLGSTTQAISTVLASFMGGLGIGGIVWGSFIDRSRRHPLRTYALIEIGIALAALFAQVIIRFSTHLYGALYQYDLPPQLFVGLRFMVTFTILCVPTFFMGGTLPCLVRFIIQGTQRDSHQGTTAGWIYGMNTIGAAAGALATGFFLIERVGLPRTLFTAVAINAGIAVLSWLISLRSPTSTGVSGESEVDIQSDRLVRPELGLLIYAFSGFVSLGLEVAWSRTLVFSIGSTTYAFSAVLVIVLAGLAIGSLVAAPFLKHAKSPARWLLLAQAAISVLTLTGLWMFDSVSLPMGEWLGFAETQPWIHRILIQFAQSAVLLLPSAILFGAVFPLAADIYLRGAGVGSRVGRLLGANTFAAIGGSLLTGWVFIPTLGIHRTYAVLASVAVLSLIYAASKRRTVIALVWIAGLIAFSGQQVLEPILPTQKLLFYSEGTNGTISVVEDSSGDRNLMIDHIAVAGTDPIFMTDQKSLAHLPMLLHPNPRKALTVGFGSGGASYSFTRYPQLESIRAVEIDPAVLRAAPYFRERNGDPFTDPRFSVIHDDARTYLRYTNDTYDIITTDCTDLRYKSNALLYTKEFFESARERLTPNGMVVAWVPLGGLAAADLKTTLRTFASSFPNTSAWYMYNYPTHYLLVVGTRAPQKIDVNQVRERMAIPAVKRDLAEIGIDGPAKLLSSFLKDHAQLLEFSEGAPINTDDRPVLEFSVPKAPHAFSLSKNLEEFVRDKAELKDLPEAVLRAREVILEGHILYNKPGSHYSAAAERYRRAQVLNPNDGTLAALILSTEQTLLERRKEHELLAKAVSTDYKVINELGLLREDAGDVDGALEAFQRAVTMAPAVAPLHLNLGRVLDLKGLSGESIAAYLTAIRLDPRFGDAWNNLGVVYLERQEYEEAYVSFQPAVELLPESPNPWINLGLAAFRSERPGPAREAFDRAIRLNPRSADAYLNRAILRFAGNDADGARSDLQAALEQQPDHAEAHYNLGIVEERRNNVTDAAAHYRRAIELNPRHVLAYNNLGILHSEAGQSKLAIEMYLKAVAVDAKNPGLRNNLAMEYVRLGNLSEAIIQYQQAIALQPGMFEPYANLGMIYRRKNQTAEAEKYLAEARKLNPNLKIP